MLHVHFYSDHAIVLYTVPDRRHLGYTRCQAAPLSSSSPDTQRRLVSYPPNLESAAAPATAFATSSSDQRGWPTSRIPTAATLKPYDFAEGDH